MTRALVIALLVAAPLALGCRRGTEQTAPAGKNPNDNLTGAQRVQHAVPVLSRTVTANDLNQLKIFLEQAHAEKGSYPKSLADLPGLQRDAPNLAGAIQDGTVVLAGGQGGVLAYDKAALTDRGNVLTTDGVQVMTADELKQKLGNSGR
jgi:hypothetical protein